MREIIEIDAGQISPSIESVLKCQGIPENAIPDTRILRLAEEAISLFEEHGRPKAILREITKKDFENIYRGEGKNAEETPIESIYNSSDFLALFAVTVGEDISTLISRLFQENDFAQGSMLDSVASESAEKSAQTVEAIYENYLRQRDSFPDSYGILRFSPGYCGWHLSAQKKLFDFLNPEEIGITLRESCLMEPLKSISGVIIVGMKEIFKFEDNYWFCAECEDHSCRERIEHVSNS
ncbi:MAG: hypothetical protein GF315_01060 [candidate division Zixibacteria bacterium]|nr:hypothetical protein [candidate division Zixibacteria bacterium]